MAMLAAGVAREAVKRPRIIVGTSLFLAGSALAYGLGIVHAWRGATETDVALNGGKGTVTNVYVMPPKECHGGYDAKIEGAKAEINTRIKLGGLRIPTTVRASETFNGTIANQVCNTGINGTEVINKQTHHVTVTIGKEALTTMVFQKNPADPNAFTADNGIGVALYKNLANNVKTLPGGVDVKGPDQLQNRLRGWALLEAFDTSSQACGETAWKYLRSPYAEEIKKDVVAKNNTYADYKITEQDVTVAVPETVDLATQYGPQLHRTKDALREQNINITNVSAKECKPSAALQAPVRG